MPKDTLGGTNRAPKRKRPRQRLVVYLYDDVKVESDLIRIISNDPRGHSACIREMLVATRRRQAWNEIELSERAKLGENVAALSADAGGGNGPVPSIELKNFFQQLV